MPDRPRIFGILNVTRDSFSDGGLFLDSEAAIGHAHRLLQEGADYIDIGGESTRPGAERLPVEEEQSRVLPLVTALAAEGVEVSVDTMNASTAERAVEAGARVINDVSGGLADPAMASVIAAAGVRYVVMHWRGHSDVMSSLAVYTDTVAEVRAELSARVEALLGAGVSPEQLVLDPGLGFAKNAEHNWQVLSGLSGLRELGFPLLLGASRKRFLAALPAVGLPTEDRGGDPRDLPTAVVSALAAVHGVWAVRVHDVASTRVALAVAEAWATGASR